MNLDRRGILSSLTQVVSLLIAAGVLPDSPLTLRVGGLVALVVVDLVDAWHSAKVKSLRGVGDALCGQLRELPLDAVLAAAAAAGPKDLKGLLDVLLSQALAPPAASAGTAAAAAAAPTPDGPARVAAAGSGGVGSPVPPPPPLPKVIEVKAAPRPL